MNILSIYYLFFIVVVSAVYFITPRKIRWVTLLIASFAYYLIYDLKLSVWLLISSLSIYIGGILIGRQEKRFQERVDSAEGIDRAAKKALKKKNARTKSLIATLIALFNIGIWVVFKFSDLFILAINNAFNTEYGLWNLAAPLGISFYSLQAISYVVDISRGKIEPQRNFLKLALWLSFFPQMIQGPICRYSQTANQLYEPHDFDFRRVKFGMQLMLWGFFKKLVIADRIVAIPRAAFSSTSAGGFVYAVGALAYTLQIYADFSGGMDIIGGAAEILGIYMPRNFERPYFSRSVAEYWRRWHITLGAWFRDYIFYPLSISKAAQALGKRCRKLFGPKLGKMLPTYLAMVIVWTMNGIWHGAGRRFAVYGMYQGILIVLGMQTESLSAWVLEKLKVRTDCFSWRLWQRARTFGLMIWGRIIFKADGVRDALRIWGNILTVRNPWVFTDGTMLKLGLNAWELFVLFLALMVLLLVSILQEKGMHMREAIERQNLAFRWLLYIVAVVVVILFGVYGEGYNASDFIYANF